MSITERFQNVTKTKNLLKRNDMKARVIETGKIVDVVSITDSVYRCLISYWDSDNKKEYSRFELDFRVGEQKTDEPLTPIDWEQRRYEIAKAAMVRRLASPIINGVDPNRHMTCVCKWSVRYADILIEQLKKESK